MFSCKSTLAMTPPDHTCKSSTNHLSSTRGAGSPILNGSDGTLSRYTGWKKLEARKQRQSPAQAIFGVNFYISAANGQGNTAM